jgi:hypothetical protein
MRQLREEHAANPARSVISTAQASTDPKDHLTVALLKTCHRPIGGRHEQTVALDRLPGSATSGSQASQEVSK